MDTCGIYNNDKEEFPKENDEGENDEGDKIIKNLPFASYNERLNHFKIGQYNYYLQKNSCLEQDLYI